MPPRRRSSGEPGLSPENLTALADALAAGKRATVYIHDATPGLGLPEGASARVVRIDGNTLTLRPRGVDDELPFEAEEVRMTKQPTFAPKPAKVAKAPAAPRPTPAARPATSAPVAAPAAQPVATPAPEPVVKAEAPAKPKARSAKKATAAVSVTIAAGPEDEWTVTVAHGSRRSKPTTVGADAVEKAISLLGDPTATEAVESALLSARKAAADRVDELSKQLAAAQEALAALG